MLATSAAVYPWIEENIHSKLKGNTGVCSNEDQFTSGLRLWKTTPSSPSSSQDLWKYNRRFIWQEEAWGKQKICFADRMCFLCTCWNSHYTLHKPCPSWQLYFKHKGLKKRARFSFRKVMHLLLLLWKSKFKNHEQTSNTFTNFFTYLIKRCFLGQE